MRITVLSYKGVAPGTPISHEFGPLGGTIGREAENDLVLPDPERHISRLHARVLCEQGVFLIEDHGGNPTLINGRPVGRGNRMPVSDADSLTIGSYELRAELSRANPFAAAAAPLAAPPASDPLGLFGGAPSADPFGAPAAPQAPIAMPASTPMPSPTPAPVSPAAPKPNFDSADDPFAVFAVASPAPAATPAQAASPLPDPFAMPAPTPKPATPLGMDLNLAPAASVDDLFGLGSGSATTDPFAGTPLSAHTAPPAAQTNAADPLALFGGTPAPAPVAAPSRDDSPMLGEHFTPPRPIATAAPAEASAAAAPSAPVQPRAPASSTDAGANSGIVVSWTDTPLANSGPARSDVDELLITPASKPSPGVSVRIEPLPPVAPPFTPPLTSPISATVAQATTPAVTPVVAPAITPDNAQRADSPPTAPPSPSLPPLAQPNAPAAPSAASPDALLAAFQRGLGFPLQPSDGLSPERMEQIGRILRESVAGTMALLTARALTKREIRAEVTMIVSKENNPLKFAPDVEFALVQLLAPQGRGFMEPVAAMRDAYDDLRSHQFGFMAGMRAALSGVLDRFKPEQLEGRITDRGFLDSVLPGSRKAKLWDLYEQHFADISREAEDDFQTLFGRAFLRAYEEQIDRLASEPGRD